MGKSQLRFIITLCSVILVMHKSCLANRRPADPCGVISKLKWGGRQPNAVTYQIFPVKNVIIHHTVTDSCDTKLKCAEQLVNIQSYHMNEGGYDDIGYNFLIDNAGHIYEGIGWHKVGAHTYGYNRKSIGIAFIGDFSEKLPSNDTLQAAQDFLDCGVRIGELDKDYNLYGGRQIIASESPGLELYNEIQDWSHWSASPQSIVV